MKIGIIGSGGREHAICKSIKKSNKISKIFCFPGNAGTEDIAENINVDLNNFEKIKISMIKIMNVHEINSFKIFKDSNKKIILPMGAKYRLVVVNNTLITILLPHHEYKMEECQ